MNNHCEHGIQLGIPCGYCLRDAALARKDAALNRVIKAGSAFVDAENPDREVCDNPECKICPAMTELDAALAACREAMGETP